MKLQQSDRRNLCRTEFHARTDCGIQHPRRREDHDTWILLQKDELPVLAMLAVIPSDRRAEIGVPAIVNRTILPDMGRMNGNWLSAVKTLMTVVKILGAFYPPPLRRLLIYD